MTTPTVDIIIAATAKIHNCTLLHHDKHFSILSKQLQSNAVDYIDD